MTGPFDPRGPRPNDPRAEPEPTKEERVARVLFQRFVEDLRACVLADAPFMRRVLYWLMDYNRLHASIQPGSPESAAYWEGRRAVALQIRGLVASVDPRLPAEMELEFLKKDLEAVDGEQPA